MATINGNDYELRALSYSEVKRLSGDKNYDADVLAVAWSSGLLPAEVQAWMDKALFPEVQPILQEVQELSGLTEGARFQQRPADDAGAAGTAV